MASVGEGSGCEEEVIWQGLMVLLCSSKAKQSKQPAGDQRSHRSSFTDHVKWSNSKTVGTTHVFWFFFS